MIAHLQEQFPLLSHHRLCQLLGVSRSWYYAHPSADARAERDLDVRDAVERVTLDFPGYGYRRVTHALQRAGWSVNHKNHKRVLRVMRQESLLCQLKRRFLVTTESAHGLTWLADLSQPVGRSGAECAEPGVGRGHHLCALADALWLSGVCARRLFAALCRLEVLAPD